MSTFYIFISLIIFFCFLLILVIMVQNPKGGGLSSSFGGGAQQMGGVQKTTDFLDKSTWILGAALLMNSDMLCRIMIQPAELPVGLITSALGAPFFLWLIFKIRE